MSDAAAPDPSDIAEQIARVLRSNAETQELVSQQQRKLASEQQKLIVEQQKLMAEAGKFARDRVLAPWRIGFFLTAAGAAFFGAGAAFIKLLGS